MALVKTKIILPHKVDKIWNIMTTLDVYDWRSDLSKIEVLDDKRFVEYTKEGYATTFTTTLLAKHKCWEFDIKNTNIQGHWIGIFKDLGNQTEIELIEEVTTRKWMMKPFIKSYLKKQQTLYIENLKKALE